MAQSQNSAIIAIIILVLIANVISNFWGKVIEDALGKEGKKHILLVAVSSTILFVLFLVFLAHFGVISREEEENIIIAI